VLRCEPARILAKGLSVMILQSFAYSKNWRARLWKRCGEVREFVDAVREVVEGRPLPEGARQEAAEWIEWATGVANAYDPLAAWVEQLPERVRKGR
jgi:hypothetical protein